MEYSAKPNVANSDLGPTILVCFALYLFFQGLIYIFRPEMTSRAQASSQAKMRRNGFIMCLIGAGLIYTAFHWWMTMWAGEIQAAHR